MRRRISVAVGGAWLLFPILWGCGLGTDISKPEWARVLLTADVPLTLEVLTSQRFLVTEASVQLMDSTTETVTLPFDKTYTLGSPARIYVRVTNTSQDTVAFNFRVYMEDRSWLNDDDVVAPGDKVEFVYRYDEFL